MPIRRVLLPLDGTPYAERAIPYAAALASVTGAQMVLAHVHTPHAAADVVARGDPQADRAAHDDATRVWDVPTYLAWVRASLRVYVPEVQIAQVDAPTVTGGLLDLARTDGCDVVVMASHARQGAGRLILGSAADELVRQGRCPVLVVPPHAPTATTAFPRIIRVLVPLDGSVRAEQALAPVLAWLGATPPSELAPRDLVLLAVTDEEVGLEPAQRYVDQQRERLAPRLPSVAVTALSTVGFAGGVIVELGAVTEPDARDTLPRCDLIVMATHGRSGLARYLYGSVATYVVAHATVPVLLVHATDASS
jgi:nucleotide-binding universal stress UspA family protein